MIVFLKFSCIIDNEQSTDIKFCFKLQKTVKNTHEMLKLVYGNVTLTAQQRY